MSCSGWNIYSFNPFYLLERKTRKASYVEMFSRIIRVCSCACYLSCKECKSARCMMCTHRSCGECRPAVWSDTFTLHRVVSQSWHYFIVRYEDIMSLQLMTNLLIHIGCQSVLNLNLICNAESISESISDITSENDCTMSFCNRCGWYLSSCLHYCIFHLFCITLLIMLFYCRLFRHISFCHVWKLQ